MLRMLNSYNFKTYKQEANNTTSQRGASKHNKQQRELSVFKII